MATFCLCPHEAERESKISGFSSYKGPDAIMKALPSEPYLNLFIFQRPSFQILPHFRLELQHKHFGDTILSIAMSLSKKTKPEQKKNFIYTHRDGGGVVLGRRQRGRGKSKYSICGFWKVYRDSLHCFNFFINLKLCLNKKLKKKDDLTINLSDCTST